MNNTTINTLDSEDFKIIYEFVNIDSNLSDNNLDKKCKQFKYECDLLKNELYSKNNIINNLNEKITELNNTNNLLLINNQNLENEKNEYNLKKIPQLILPPSYTNEQQKKKNTRGCIDIFTLFSIHTSK